MWLKRVGNTEVEIMSKQITGWYADVFKAWPKGVGPKPSAADLDTIHKLGARPGKQAMANAMALRADGVTGSEIVIVCGAPQLNKMRGFITDNLLKREAVPPRNNHTVYKLTVTAKGQARVKGKVQAEADAPKPDKPKRARKPKAPKPKAEAPAAAEPVAADIPQA